MDNLIGRKLDGRYEILQQIGAGGMANVYKAVDVADGKTVAVKVLRDEFVDNEELLRRFKNESKAISLLSHPNIVKVFDVNFSDATQYIVMEYIEGITLMQYLEHKKRLGWKDALHFTVQVLRALQHAHDRGIVHRDIKPQNIMLMKDGTIKVMDFGIARFSRSQTRTITDKAIGSVHYISPEQAKGIETDEKSDIYSLGVMLYEMLTGTLPFESDSAVSVAIQQISAKPKSLREIDPTIPEALEEITLKAMAKEPADRYASASLMLKDIEEFKTNPSVRFEYKYTDTESPSTKYQKVVAENTAKPETPAASRRASGKKSAGKKPHPHRTGIFVMFGITFACVIASLVMMFLIFSVEGSIFSKYEDVTLPNFTNATLESVQNNADYAGFTFEIVHEYNTDYAAGMVFDQYPLPPKTVKENATITLYVSDGIEYVNIPEVKGIALDDAITQLISQHLIVELEEATSSAVKEGQAIKTNPAANTLVEAWTVVTLQYRKSTTKPTTIVPNLLGLQEVGAEYTLRGNNLVPGKITYEYNEEYAYGRVCSQQYDEGISLNVNTSVAFVVSLGKQPVELPVVVSGYGEHTLQWIWTDGVGDKTADQTLTAPSATILIQGDGSVVVKITKNGGDPEVDFIEKTYTFTEVFETGFVLQINVSAEIPAEWAQSGGEDPGGEDPGGEDPGGEDPGGENPGGEVTPPTGGFRP